ncbi:hypothetical protein [Parafrankia discariae]|uniref:hypothetical protein n=1 Tax=Parafrankia discariae TaxID=365528 RepID=UPI0003A47F38|nr:hypothetical protein [Parafrankia discariae]
MPCYRCSARQTDPVRGASPWQRAVVGGEQVLVCPTCRPSPEWEKILDRCDRCASTHLAKALGTVFCRACGERKSPDRQPAGRAPAPEPPPSAHEPVPSTPTPPRTAPTAAETAPGAVETTAGAAPRRPAAGSARSTTATTDTPEASLGRPDGEPVELAAEGPERALSGDLAADVDAALARMFGRPRPVS